MEIKFDVPESVKQSFLDGKTCFEVTFFGGEVFVTDVTEVRDTPQSDYAEQFKFDINQAR
jgi:hypothetical protein